MTILTKNPQRILIIQTAFLGDVILTLPLLQKAASMFPKATIDFLAIPAAENLLESHPDISRLWIYDKHRKDRGLKNSLRLIRALRDEKFDLALIPHRSMRSALLARSANIPERIGFNRSAGSFLFSKVLPYPFDIHEINRNLHLLQPFGIDSSERIFPTLHFEDQDKENVKQWLMAHEISSSSRYIVIAPGSVWATKRWLPEYFGELGDMLAQNGYKIIQIGGNDDRETSEQVQAAAQTSFLNAVGRFSLRESAWLIKNAQLLITNDSAPLHMATAVRTPMIAVFGATVQKFGFSPYAETDRVIENNSLTCRPCGKHGGHKCPIGTFDCMKTITANLVYHEAEKLLEKMNDATL